MLFVQQRLYEGLQPDENNDYVISRKEFVERLPIPQSTFNSNIHKLVDYAMQQWNLYVWFGLEGLADQNLYVDIRYENGKLKFKRNPYTLRPELSYLWGRQPYGWKDRRFNYQSEPVPEGLELPIKRFEEET